MKEHRHKFVKKIIDKKGKAKVEITICSCGYLKQYNAWDTEGTHRVIIGEIE